MKERLDSLIGELRKQRVVERLVACKNAQEADSKFWKMRSNMQLFTTPFVIDFNALCQETKKNKNLLNVKVKPEDAILTCILCYMMSIPCEKLVNSRSLKRALKKVSKQSLKQNFSRNRFMVAKKLWDYMYKKKGILDCTELKEEEFVKFFL